MWWYRDKDKKAAQSKGTAEAVQAPRDPLVAALRTALGSRPQVPDYLLAMSLVVDSRIELADGTVREGTSWGEAEKLLQAAGDGSVRIYNQFARDFGDGYSRQADLPAPHRETLDALRASLRAAPGIARVD